MKSGDNHYTIDPVLLASTKEKLRARGKEKQLLTVIENWNLYNYLLKTFPSDYPFIYELYTIDQLSQTQIAKLLGRSRERISQIITMIEYKLNGGDTA